MKEMEFRGIIHVIFETDSNTVVDAIHNVRGSNLEFSFLFCTIKNIMFYKSNFVAKFIK
jgi:hypothetical protein